MLIEFCKKENISDVMNFIHEHWKNNHILSENIALMNYQHYDELHDRYNYIVAYNEQAKIEGLLGFIPASKYDFSQDDYLWLSLWKTISHSDKNLGLKLLMFLEKNVSHKLIGTLGISEEAEKIYKILKYHTGKLEHYYIGNPSIADYKVCINPKRSGSLTPQSLIDFEEISDLDTVHINELSERLFSPNRTIEYAVNKYQKHPIYDYSYLNFKDLNIILVIRKIIVNNITIVRVVDVLGNAEELYKLARSLEKYIAENNFEYIDILNYGLDKKSLIDNGFSSLENHEKSTIIPMYFEPFLQENKTIGFAYKTKLDNVLLFKGDADQDRPNIFKSENI